MTSRASDLQPPRQPGDRRSVLLGAALLATAALAEWATPRRMMAQESPLPELKSLVPLQCGAWRGEDASRLQLVSPDVQAVMDTLYQQTLARLYHHPRWGTVMLAVAYGGDQSDATRVHRPEVCYPAQGFTVGPSHETRLALGPRDVGQVLPVRRLQARIGSRHEPITYWMTVGQRPATRASQQKWNQIEYGLRGIVPDGLLMRVSSIDRDEQQAWWVHHRFIEALFLGVVAPMRARVFGQAFEGPAR